MSLSISCDVAIAGGGPGGATLAALLAKCGMSVAVFDRDEFPRDKLCGEFLSYDALPVLDLIGLGPALDEVGATRIRTCRLIGPTFNYSFELPREARGISRLRLDEMLLRRAAALGASVHEGWTVDTVTRTAAGFALHVRDGSREAHHVTAKLVVGAWGRWGRIDRQLERPFTRDTARRHFGFKRHYRVLPEGQVPADHTIDLYSFARGYLGVNAVEGDTVNICGLVHASRLDGHRGGWETFVDNLSGEGEHFARLFGAHEPAQEHFLSSEPVIFAARSPVVSGILMVGDAAGLIDPLAGNGMAMAIQSALVAATLVVRRPELDADAIASEYETAYRDLFLDRIRWSRRVAWILSRPWLVDRAARILRAPSIGSLLLARTRATDAQVAELVGSFERARDR
ncbi:MAG: NAD(P)/FAD-dependent oxidoreductase [Thermoanaerobaculia bacterium]|nr:NAD(P)/FAD-dependent oxidoreductase [Thermoanaerobaculia bacterium]